MINRELSTVIYLVVVWWGFECCSRIVVEYVVCDLAQNPGFTGCIIGSSYTSEKSQATTVPGQTGVIQYREGMVIT